MDFPKRKSPRLAQYDYSSPGAYFITICAKDKSHIFGKISVGQGLAPAVMHLSKYGQIAVEQTAELEQRYATVTVDKYVVMPNHIHLLLTFSPPETAGASPCPTLSDVICTFKSLTARKCRQAGFEGSLFQFSFHDHIIRNDADYRRIWAYIDTNPGKWVEDCYYAKEGL